MFEAVRKHECMPKDNGEIGAVRDRVAHDIFTALEKNDSFAGHFRAYSLD